MLPYQEIPDSSWVQGPSSALLSRTSWANIGSGTPTCAGENSWVSPSPVSRLIFEPDVFFAPSDWAWALHPRPSLFVMSLALPKTKNRRVLEDFFAGDGCLMMHRWFIYLVYMAGELNGMQNLRRVIKRHFFDFAKCIRIPGLVAKRFGHWRSQ